MEDKPLKLLENSKKSDETVSLTEILELLGNSNVKEDTRRKRISRIIAANNIKTTESSAGKQIAKSDIAKIKKLYFEKFHDDSSLSNNANKAEELIREKEHLIDELNKEKQEYVQRINTLESQIKDKDAQISKKDELIKDLSNRIANAFQNSQELDFAKLKLDYQERITKESDKVGLIGQQLTDSKQQIIDLQQDLIDKNTDISERDISITKLESKLKEQKYKLMNRSLIDRIINKDISEDE